MVIRNLILFVLLLTPLASLSAFAKVSATVDRAIIEEGETFILTIKSDGDSPELDVLSKDFTVLGTSQSSKMSFVNGSFSSEKEWIVNLSPKKQGISVIPALVVGKERTKPIQIKVVESTALSAGQGADIFLEVTLDTNSAYVQSEVIYTAKLFRAVEIREGSLTEPDIAAAVVERMGEDVTYQTTRNERRYQVTERHFAIFPQKSGNLVISPTVFDGQVFAQRQPQPGRANDPFDRFFQSQQRMKRVRVKSNPIVLEVLPQPIEFKGDVWLPAKRLVLTESWSVEPPQFKVGEPITRTLRIEAIGQTGAQLPEFEGAATDGIKQYVDQPKVETGLMEGSLVGIREEKLAIIPTKSGELTLPEMRLYWWDTELDREQVFTIASRLIEVAPEAIDEAAEQKEIASTDVEAVSNDVQVEQKSADIIVASGYWPLIALALSLGWLLTIIAWFFQKKKQQSRQGIEAPVKEINTLTLKAAKKQLKDACKKSDEIQAKLALLAWANAAWPEQVTTSLIAVGEGFSDVNAKQAVRELDKALYANDDKAWNGEKFWSDVGSQLNKPRNIQQSKLKSLPALYPE